MKTEEIIKLLIEIKNDNERYTEKVKNNDDIYYEYKNALILRRDKQNIAIDNAVLLLNKEEE